MAPQGIGKLWGDGNKAVLEELGIAYGQHRIVQVDIVERQALCFTEAKTGPVEQQEQHPQGAGIKLKRVLPTGIDSPEKALQFITREDVRRCRTWFSRLVISRRKR